MKKLIFTALYSAIFISVAFSSVAFSTEITVVTEQYPPYEYIENNKWSGHDIEIVKEASRRLGIKPVFKELPWKRCLKNVEEGKSEAIISLIKTPERSDYLFFPSANISYEKNVIFGHKKIKINGLDDFKGKLIGIQSGYSYGKEFDNHKNIKKDPSFSQTMLLKKFDADRTNYIIGNEAVLIYLNRKAQLKPIKQVYTVSEDPMYIAFSKKHPEGKELSEKYNKALNDMKKEGIIEQIIKKYQ